VFTNILLADEVNRAPPKTQAALLEAMQERQVTAEDRTRRLERPFLVLATQNPIEYEGTYPLPEAQLDRFLIRMRIGYPSAEAEWLMLERRLDRRQDEAELAAVVSREELVAMQRTIEIVHVSEGLGRYIVALTAATRDHRSVQVGASPRGTLAVTKLARVAAALDGREFVVPDDVKQVAIPALAHRLVLRPELWVQSVQPEDVVKQCLDSVPVPAADEGSP
jgi:MoxR-like ATPase